VRQRRKRTCPTSEPLRAGTSASLESVGKVKDMREQDSNTDERPRGVVVKFDDSVSIPSTDVPYRDGLEQILARGEHARQWQKFVAEFPDCTFLRLFRSLDVKDVQDLIRRATKLNRDERDPPYRTILSFFVVSCPEHQELDSVADALRRLPMIAMAYVAPTGAEPTCQPWYPRNVNSLIPGQRYLKPARLGIDAQHAWTAAGGDGCGQDFVDLERGWTFEHHEIAHLFPNPPAPPPPPLTGANTDGSRAHGTAVLGVVCGGDNNFPGVGIAPNVASVSTVSWSGDETHVELPNATTIPNAIAVATAHLCQGSKFGGVLLLEAQVKLRGVNPWLPCEVDPAIFTTIKLAVDSGVVVVEAAGNGLTNLDNYRDAQGKRVLRRYASLRLRTAFADFRDSGAIVVAAAENKGSDTNPKWKRHGSTNFGTRIDCFAHGRWISTASSDPTGDRRRSIADFAGTSGASAIIAGAALAIQGIRQSRRGSRFRPEELRQFMASNGTQAVQHQKIGLMPDLRMIEPLV